jgi:hypothetical protein
VEAREFAGGEVGVEARGFDQQADAGVHARGILPHVSASHSSHTAVSDTR